MPIHDRFDFSLINIPTLPGMFPSRDVRDRTLPLWTVAGIPGLSADAINTILDQGHMRTWEEIAAMVGQGLTAGNIVAIWDWLTGESREPSAEGACLWPERPDPVTGECVAFLGTQPGPDGQPVNGRYGTGMVPMTRNIMRHVCPKGMVLGDDRICYNRRNISNKDREWPKGTRPLGTPEEMRAVRIASRFAGRFERTTKRMQKIGLAKKPAPRARRLSPPHHDALHHGGVLKVIEEVTHR